MDRTAAILTGNTARAGAKGPPKWLPALRKEFGKSGSFALWPDGGKSTPRGMSRFVEGNIRFANPSVVLVGLCPDVDLGAYPPWCAYHVSPSCGAVPAMAAYLSAPPWRGAYMTYLLKGLVEKNPVAAGRAARRDRALRAASEEAFLREMEILGQKDPAIMVFGYIGFEVWRKCTGISGRFRARLGHHNSHLLGTFRMVESWKRAAGKLGLPEYVVPALDAKPQQP